MKVYASLEWPYHILSGFQGQELELDEEIIDSLISLIQNLLNLQGERWYNTILNSPFSDEKEMLSYLEEGKIFFQVSSHDLI